MPGTTEDVNDGIVIEERNGDDEIIIRIPKKENLIISLLTVVKKVYRMSHDARDDSPDRMAEWKANENAIGEAISSWIAQIKEEKDAFDRYEKIKSRFDSTWHKW